MKTISIQVQDSFMQKFLNFVNSHSKDIIITKDANLELDPYFYERQNELNKIRDDIKSGKSKLISFEDFEHNVNQFEKKLELKYAN